MKYRILALVNYQLSAKSNQFAIPATEFPLGRESQDCNISPYKLAQDYKY